MTIRIPPHVSRIAPYVPGTPIESAEREFGLREVVKLASNENPLGPSPRAVEAVRGAVARAHRYPDGSGHALRATLAARHGVPPEQIVLGNGSTELVEVIAKTFLGAGRGAVTGSPAFIMYRIAVHAMAAPLVEVPLLQDRFDLDAIARACGPATALVYIGNPNNPTGTTVTREDLRRYFERLPSGVLTVLDEAYRDYVEAPDHPDGLEFLREGRPLVVLRTFSKIYGLAGMRIGYAVAAPAVARAIDAIRSPFNTSVAAQAAALAALDDEEHVRRSRGENARERRFLEEELRRRGLKFVPGVANFLLVDLDLAAPEAYSRLLRRGVIVRPMEAYGYDTSIRVSVGTRPENLRFLQALDQALREPRDAAGQVS